uniref:Uncharacterized protein n=1 Tax=uncultured prokaryote TaxID=198431 RepID=A0A0H5Q5S0_9ZZZZ|nr:hypothetical protein [uncultured prokaryote]
MATVSYRYEGMYATSAGLNLCLRVETGGVPRFENVYLKAGDLRLGDTYELQRFVVMCLKAQNGPPWADEPLPGIDSSATI